ncbi:hypothetical protein MSAN_00596700 [Mycena sanguinolenta]|uniref:DUF6534 domain-containing protein n=1 Tax=Mycena sanguinolenta TaxID=230812 RepID=A0A8H6Z7A1_9AGAR|nr:hypothetical protein MSAN_00596700 [Mycena sanguinolenta]
MPSAATLDPGAPLDNTMGALVMGLVGSAILYGISMWQTASYFTWYRRDPSYLKVLVLATLLLDTLHMVLISHVVYHYLITNYYNREELQVVVWSITTEALPTSLTTVLVQLFYASRVYKATEGNFLLTGVILLLVAGASGCGIAWVTLALSKIHTYHRLLRLSPLAMIINALSSAADVLITLTLCYKLYKSQAKPLRNETFLNRVVLITINTGLLTTLCALAALISMVCSPNTLIYVAFYFCIGRLYSNALLATLNSRTVVRGRIRDMDSNGPTKFHPTLTDAAEIVAATELASRMDREAELYADGFYAKGDDLDSPSWNGHGGES